MFLHLYFFQMDREFIYKYRELTSLDNTLKATTLNLLIDHQFRFSDPIDFKNMDTEDADLPLDWSATDGEIRKFIKACFRNYGLAEFADQFLLPNKKLLRDFWQDFSSQGLNTGYGTSPKCGLLKVFCASIEYDNPTLWSEFANNHTGVCVGIKSHVKNGKKCIKLKPASSTQQANTPSRNAGIMEDTLAFMKHRDGSLGLLADPDGSAYYFPVEYCDDPLIPQKVVSWFIDEDIVPRFIYRKASRFSSEREVRIVLSPEDAPNNIAELQNHEIGEIIFGMHTSDDTISQVLNKLQHQNNLDNIEFYKMEEGDSFQRRSIDIKKPFHT